jgi:uncharacterized protein (TIRG00374 family)
MNLPPASFPEKVINFSKIVRILIVVIPLAFAGNIIYILLTSELEILQQLRNYSLWYLALAAVLVFIPWLAHSARILIWSVAFDKKMTLSDSFKTAVATDVGGAIAPTAIGGSYVKLALLARFGFSPGEATLVTLLGTLEDAFFFIFAIPISLAITGAWDNPGIRQVGDNIETFWPYLTGLGLIASLAYVLLKIRRKIGPLRRNGTDPTNMSLVTRIRERIGVYKTQFLTALDFVRRRHIATFIACAFLAGIGWICRYSVITLLAEGLGCDADPILLFMLQWVVFTLMTMFPTPGAVGGAELSFALIYRGVLPAESIPILMGGWRFLTFYLLMIVGAIIVLLTGIGNPGGNRAGSKPTHSQGVGAV